MDTRDTEDEPPVPTMQEEQRANENGQNEPPASEKCRSNRLNSVTSQSKDTEQEQQSMKRAHSKSEKNVQNEHETQTTTNNVACPACKKNFFNESSLRRHIKSKHHSQLRSLISKVGKRKAENIQCPYCEEMLFDKHTLNRHIERKHECVCYICRSTYKRFDTLSQHYQKAHVREKRKTKPKRTPLND